MDFHALEHHVRSCALVGAFLQRWAFMENSLDAAIGKALRLDDLQRLVVVKNSAFSAKIHILKAALHLAPLLPDEREPFISLLNKLMDASNVRNMMAHEPFIPSQTCDGVEFVVIKARGLLNFPEEIWPITKFQEWLDRMENWGDEIDRLQPLLVPERIKALAAALRNYGGDPDSDPAFNSYGS